MEKAAKDDGVEVVESVAEQARAALMKGEGLVLQLLRPIKLADGSRLEALTLRPCRGREMRKLPIDFTKLEQGQLLDVAAMLSGQPPAVLDQLDSIDVHRVGAAIMVFLLGARPTGARG